MKPQSFLENFKTPSDQQDEIHIIEQPKETVAQPKRKKEQSLFKPNADMQQIQISVIGYEKQSFLKIETQIYKIELRNQKSDTLWMIKRRYSDVLWLHQVFSTAIQSLSVNHLGYILPFFPGKSIESFFTAKLNIGINKERKDNFITERAEIISDFLRKIYSHPQLKYSDEARVFLLANDNDFNAERKKMQSFSEEYKELETSSSSFLGLIEKGTSILSSYMGTMKLARDITEQDRQFEDYNQKIVEKGNAAKILSKNIEQLALLKRQQADFQPIQGDIDKIQVINAKLNTSRQPNSRLSENIISQVMRPLNHVCFWWQQIAQMLEHRKRLIQFLFSLKQNIDDISRIRKLERRIQKFQNNFRKTWKQFVIQAQSDLSQVIQNFQRIWRDHGTLMSKIWK